GGGGVEVQHLGVGAGWRGAPRLERRVVLIDAHAVAEIGAEPGERLAHALQDELGLALQARRAERGEALRAFDFRRRARREVERFLAGEEEPRPGLYRVGTRYCGSCKPFDRADFDAGQRSRGGQSLMKPSRFGIFTCGRVCAFITTSSPTMPFNAST